MKRSPLVTLSVFLAFSTLGSQEARAASVYSHPPHDATEVCLDRNRSQISCSREADVAAFMRIRDIMEAASRAEQNAGPPPIVQPQKPKGPPIDFATSAIIGANINVPMVELTELGTNTAGAEFGLRFHIQKLFADLTVGGQGMGANVEARIGYPLVPIFPALNVVVGGGLRKRYDWIRGQEKVVLFGLEAGWGHEGPREVNFGALWTHSGGLKGTPVDSYFPGYSIHDEFVDGIQLYTRLVFKIGGRKHGEPREGTSK
jgi:hypothetical protein